MYDGLDPRVANTARWMKDTYGIDITSGYRDPARNAAVGGARGSQHMHGNAIDFPVRGLPEEKQREIVMGLRERGFNGFGYYPRSGTMHADVGAARAWGPNYRSSSLDQTPEWFRRFVNYDGKGAPGASPQPQSGAVYGPPMPGPTPQMRPGEFGPPMPPNSVPPTPVESMMARAGASPVAEAAAKPLPTLGNFLRGLGNKMAPDTIDAPKNATPEQLAAFQREQRDSDGGMRDFAALAQMGAPRASQRPPMGPPQVVRGQFQPLQPFSGLLG